MLCSINAICFDSCFSLNTYPLIKYFGSIPKIFLKYINFILSRSWHSRKKRNEKHDIALSVVNYNETVLRLFVTHSHISYAVRKGDTHVLCGSDNFKWELKNQREIRKNNDVRKNASIFCSIICVYLIIQ